MIACSHFMREQIADIFGVEEGRISVIPNESTPTTTGRGTRSNLRARAQFGSG